MNMMQPATDNQQPRPSLCPICGHTADNGVPRRDTTNSVTYCDDLGHLWSVAWVVA